MHTAPPVDHDDVTSRFNRTIAVLLWVCSAVSVVSFAVVSTNAALLALFPAAWLSVFAWVALWRPGVTVTDESVTLRNVFRTIEIPWPALIHVDTKFALTLYTPGHKYSAWAAPAPGHLTSVRAARAGGGSTSAGAFPHSDGGVRPGDLLGTESGQAAYLVRTRWARLQNQGAIEAGVAEQTPVTVTMHWASVVAVVLLGAATVAVAVLT